MVLCVLCTRGRFFAGVVFVLTPALQSSEGKMLPVAKALRALEIDLTEKKNACAAMVSKAVHV